jgi:hypothetical protein
MGVFSCVDSVLGEERRRNKKNYGNQIILYKYMWININVDNEIETPSRNRNTRTVDIYPFVHLPFVSFSKYVVCFQESVNSSQSKEKKNKIKKTKKNLLS